jgi:hypothetical protein
MMKDVGGEGSRTEGVGLVYESLMLCRVHKNESVNGDASCFGWSCM